MSIIGTVAVCALCALVLFWLGKKVFVIDEKIEDRRRAAAKLAASLGAYGLVKLPDLLIDYSVGDYSGMFEKMVDFTKLLASGEAAVVSEFDAVFERVLARKLETEEGRVYLAARVGEANIVSQ